MMEHIVKVCVHLKHDCRCINDNTYINHYFEMTLSDVDECAWGTDTCHRMLIAVIHTGATVVSVKLDMKGMDLSTAQVRDY